LDLIDGKFKKEDEPKVEAHEYVEHNHNLVIVEDCSTSWSSDDDNRSTTTSLDKIDNDATSDANDDATPYTLDGNDDDSCSDDIATTRPSTTPHCSMSQGDTKVLNDNVVDHVESYDELVSRLASMTISLENEKAKTLKLENKNSFLKNSCEEHKHLMFLNLHMMS
jgi:heme-binding NEAT domain protein